MITQFCLQEGLVVYPGGGSNLGKNGDHILIAPPLIISEEEINELFIKLEKAIQLTENYLRKDFLWIS